MAAHSKLVINRETGRLNAASWQPSPNCSARPAGVEPELIVIHAISLPPGQFGGEEINALFSNSLETHQHPYFEQLQDLRVSAHFLVRRDGEIIQYVSLNDQAWHAGLSTYAGRGVCNEWSVGIELEGCDDQPFEQEQYVTLKQLVNTLKDGQTRLKTAAVVGHCDIAPGRKTDPGPNFDWSKLA